MRKRYTACLLVLLLALTALAGCGQSDESRDGGESSERIESFESSAPAEGQEEGLKQAFLEKYVRDPAYTAADLRVEYIAMCDGYCAVYVHGALDYTQAEDAETVGGVTFRYPTGQHLLVYDETDGGLYSLQEALDGQVLDGAGLEKIHEAHREAQPGMYEEEEMMMEVTDREILRAFIENNPSLMEDCTEQELSVLRIGVFGGCHAVFVNGPFFYNDVIVTQTVDGLDFVYGSSHTMNIYRDGKLYTLPEAWDAGVISRSALKELHKAFGGGNGRETE